MSASTLQRESLPPILHTQYGRTMQLTLDTVRAS